MRRYAAKTHASERQAPPFTPARCSRPSIAAHDRTSCEGARPPQYPGPSISSGAQVHAAPPDAASTLDDAELARFLAEAQRRRRPWQPEGRFRPTMIEAALAPSL